MIGQLGATTDPTQLIPGSFAALFADAQDLRARAREVLEEHDGPISRDVAAWVGDAAERCDVRRANVAKGLTGVAHVFGVAAAVLEAHAEVLRWGQGRAVLAIELWAAGVAKAADAGVPTMTLRPQVTDAFGNGPVIPEVDPGAMLRRSAEHVLAVAWREVHASETAVCEVLDNMAEGLPDGNCHLEDFFGGIREWVAGLAQLGWRFNPGRFLIDPAGMMSDSRDRGEGLLYSFDVDDQGYPLFLDLDTLHDNPGRWWGRAAPDIALAALPAGAAATRLLGSMELGDRFAAALRALSVGDDTGMIDFAAWLRKEPIQLTDGTIASVDGITSPYGAVVGDAKLISKPGQSIYIPETVGPRFAPVATEQMDIALRRLQAASNAFEAGRPVEVVTNNAASAAAWEARMRALNIPGYVRIQP